MQKLFVYGTLKRGCTNHHFLKDQSFLGEAFTRPCYRMYDVGGFPGLVLDPHTGYAIKGELWEIDQDCLVKVDWLEDVASGFYARAMAQLTTPHEEIADAIVYLFCPDTARLPEVGEEWKVEREFCSEA